MQAERLLQQQAAFDPEDIEAIFGREFILDAPDPAVDLAPVQRVALITEAFLPKVDGVSKTALLTLQYLKHTGREVLVFAPDNAPDAIFNTRIVPLPSLQLPNVPETRMALPNPYVARELRAFQPDLIHICSPALMSISGVWAGRNMDVPIVANYQTDLPGFARLYGLDVAALLMQRWLRYIHNSCHVTLVPSEHTEAQIRAHGIRRIRRWGRGVDIRRFNPAHRSKEWRAHLLDGRDPESLLCVYVGRLATEKCIEQLVEVARLPGVALTIIGDGAQREELETIFAGTGTVFTGYLLGDALPAAFASADVFVFTGPSETFGQVVQEAMASGLPSVVTDSGGVADLVIPGETGFHAAPDPADFAEKVRRLRDDTHLREQMGRTARELAEERPWEKILAGLEPIWSEAVALNRRYMRRYGPVRQQFRLPLP